MYGNNAFLACGTRGLYIIDISDPTQPALAGIYDSDGVVNAVKIAIANGMTLAYLADGNHGIKVIDCTDAANPMLLHYYPQSSYIYDLCLDSRFIYAVGTDGLAILQESGGSISTIAEYPIDEAAKSVYIDSDYIYVCYGLNKVAILEYQE